MLSRIAENLYWMGRYIERAENTARLLDVNYLAILEAPQILGTKGFIGEKWFHLLDIMESKEHFQSHYQTATAQNVPYWLALDADNPASIRSSIRFARENARALRDRISTEMWEAINRSYHQLCLESPKNIEEYILHDYCLAAREASHLFFGIAHATLPHDLGWNFMRAGQFLERADNTLRTLQANNLPPHIRTPVEAGIEIHRDIALLNSLSAFEAFRKRYSQSLTPSLIYEFLLFNESFPRSLRYSLTLLVSTLQQIRDENQATSHQGLHKASHLTEDVIQISGESQVTVHHKPSFRELLDRIAEVSIGLSDDYFGVQQRDVQQQTQSQSTP